LPYIALRRLLVGKDHYREVGEHVPEADSWHNVRPWIAGGFIREVPETMVVHPASHAPSARKAKEAPEEAKEAAAEEPDTEEAPAEQPEAVESVGVSRRRSLAAARRRRMP
jgi:hypothetical protein